METRCRFSIPDEIALFRQLPILTKGIALSTDNNRVMQSVLKYLFCVGMILSISVLCSLPASIWAGDICGTVRRPPATVDVNVSVDRYVGRDALPHHQSGPDCVCNPARYAVVYLTGDSLPPIQLSKEHPTMAQRDMMFVPSVLAVAVGTTVSFPNDDPFFHNVFSYSKTKRFDLGRYPKGKFVEVTLGKPGIIKVFCEIHFSMRAYIHVLPTPYFAVSDDKGGFSIPHVKSGDYTLHVWQENLPEIQKPVTVTSTTQTVDIP
jgi:plastocyanin